MGDRALLLEVRSGDEVAALHQRLRRLLDTSGRATGGDSTASDGAGGGASDGAASDASDGAGDGASPVSVEVAELVPGARTLLLRTRGVPSPALREALRGIDIDAAANSFSAGNTFSAGGAGNSCGTGGAGDSCDTSGAGGEATDAGAPDPIRIPVRYDGPDLAEVAERTGLTAGELIAAHTGTLWRAAFAGFAPGFAYLTGGDPRLSVPRRATPRTEIPSGAVGMAGEYCGIYPRRSPGGWQLIGSTDVVLWDERRDPPALLAPGTAVRFVAVDAAVDTAVAVTTPESP